MVKWLLLPFRWFLACFLKWEIGLLYHWQAEMLASGLVHHPRYKKLQRSREKLQKDLADCGYIIEEGKLVKNGKGI